MKKANSIPGLFFEVRYVKRKKTKLSSHYLQNSLHLHCSEHSLHPTK